MTPDKSKQPDASDTSWSLLSKLHRSAPTVEVYLACEAEDVH
eukprot:CAMPEP_0170584212 /NCGR_PEP_ID=MMETSP0224-20130122/8570_1 /TAXON_ID=285029 /ORGANISM="Togula jolla, Strain CCCM 725" /LENGTH=41 /DNA_ID= /DNA_START= /DNA_END= /DNA_ORIENTATION=